MKVSVYALLFLIAACLSCSQPTQTQKDLRESLNKPLLLGAFETVRLGKTLLSFDELRHQYQFLSVVYLRNGCKPCYPKFVEWHQKMAEMGDLSNYSILFVLQTDSYNGFMQNIQELGETIEEKYYIIIYPVHQFVINNSQIPDWILNSSMLIDSENKIKMGGALWLNEDMTNLFYKTVSNEQSLHLE